MKNKIIGLNVRDIGEIEEMIKIVISHNYIKIVTRRRRTEMNKSFDPMSAKTTSDRLCSM